ncbi:MAG TPA: hypothetical protein VGL61_19770 [Kofleriaceae bacterium]|jgi:hypothetical protein
MSAPKLELGKLARIRPWEYALRFAFGGALSVAVALVTKRWGVATGGLYLAFPSILPASLTLAKRHDGRKCAAEDARGARLGAIGMACFAAVVAVTATRWPPWLVLAAAGFAWATAAGAAWWLVESRR